MFKSHASKYTLLGLLLAFVLTSAFGCKGTSEEVQQRLAPTTLEYWTVFNDSFDIFPLVQQYQTIHPNVQVNVRKFRFEEYERELVNALAEDRGPDIFSIHNTWTRGYENKLASLPASITLPFQFVTGTLKKELQTELRTQNSLTPADVKRQYPDVVFQDAIINGQVYGLPLSMDTMVMYYNIDLLNNAGIAQPPTNWEDFRQQVVRISKKGAEGELLQSAAAIGTASNVTRSFDLVSLLMMQNGTQMADGNIITFHQNPGGFGTSPAEQALSFYTSFANPASENYTYNEAYPNDIDAFINGQTAFFFGYNYNLDDIKARAPKLNYGIQPMLQIGDGPTINYANYWLEGVSKKSANQDWSWDFIQYITSAEQVKTYLDNTNRVTALRSLINEQLEDEERGIFVSQVLTARSWYTGKDIAATENAFDDLINFTLNPLPNQSISDRIRLAAQRVSQTY